MATKTCKVCGETKEAVQGTWVTRHGVVSGGICLACHGAREISRYRADVTRKLKYAAATKRRRSTEAGRLKANAATATWQRNNPEKQNAANMKRRAAKLNRTPKWANLYEIAKFYALATELSVLTGVRHAVYHVIPLQGKLVSGLHVHNNLQVITFSENSAKQNKFLIE